MLQNNYYNTFQLDDSGKIQLLKQLDYESNTTVYDLDVVLQVNYYLSYLIKDKYKLLYVQFL